MISKDSIEEKGSLTDTDILFVVPAFTPKIKEESLGTLILARKAELSGFKVKILRYWDASVSPKENYDGFKEEFIQEIVSVNPRIVSFYCRCEEYHICIDLSSALKDESPEIIITFGGPQAELVAKATLATFPQVDYICCSEGENTIIPLLDVVVHEKGCLKDIPGLVFRAKNNTIIQNQLPDFLSDNYIRRFRYYDLIPQDLIINSACMPIDVGRGCPFSCTYCSTKTFWKRKFRLRNLDDIVDEIEYVNQTYGIKKFDFMHDLFTVNKKRLLQFCDKLSSKGLNVSWGCDSRIDTIDREMIDRMVDCGLTDIFFGIETGSERMQNIIDKHLNLKSCYDVVEYCISKGIQVTTSFIYGFPEEKEEDLSKTLKMAVEFQNFGCNVLTNLCHIMNGTELFARFNDTLEINRNTAYNNCIVGFNELYDMIAENKQMFANFCDFPTPLRDEMKYIDAFRYTLHYAFVNMQNSTEVLREHQYASLSMYRTFCKVNQSIFDECVPSSNGDVTSIRKTFKHTSAEVYKRMIANLDTAYSK